MDMWHIQSKEIANGLYALSKSAGTIQKTHSLPSLPPPPFHSRRAKQEAGQHVADFFPTPIGEITEDRFFHGFLCVCVCVCVCV